MQRPERWGSRSGNTIHLGPVRGGERRVAGAQEPAANREAGEALDLFDARLLQQRQCLTTCADKDEFGVQLSLFAGTAIADQQRPTAVRLTEQVANLMTEQRRCAIAHAKAD